jgi:hypothetical protein
MCNLRISFFGVNHFVCKTVKNFDDERVSCCFRDGTGDLGGGWFGECVQRQVEDGADTLFWTDPWLDGIPLRVRYKQLFELA